jgi:predicted acylesterase/phospholipase RssA
MTTEIQVAFQGGGARLIPLLATAHALRDAEAKNLVKVTRVAGTSAGAIAACLYATGEDISRVQQHLRDSGAEYLVDIFPRISNRASVLTRVGLGIPLVNEKRLRSSLGKLFAIFNGHSYRVLKDLKIPVNITAAELVNQKLAVFRSIDTSDITIIDALFHSCGLPFIIKSHRNIGNPAFADGGICANFPADVLTSDPTDGRIIGISFADCDIPQRAENVFELALSLINTAISAAMDNTKINLGKENVFPINTELRTFDFKIAFSNDFLVTEWRKVYLEFTEWLNDWLSKTLKNNVIEVKPIDPSGDLRSFSNRLYEVFDAQHKNITHKSQREGLVAHAYSLLDADDNRHTNPDEVIEHREFQVGDETLYCIKIDIASDGESMLEGLATYDLFDDEKNTLKIIVIPVVDDKSGAEQGRSPSRRHVLVFFDPPLTPSSKKYTLIQQDQVRGAMAPLKIKGSDHLSHRSTKQTDIVDLVLAVPRNFPPLALSPRASPYEAFRTIQGRPMTESEIRHYGVAPAGFRFIGWTAQNVNAGDFVGVNFSVIR